MNLKEKQNLHTDQAWSNLYARLEKEGLVAPYPKPFQQTRHLLAGAAAVLLVLVGALSLFQWNKQVDNGAFLSIHNQDAKSKLVTTLEDGSIIYLGENTTLNYPTHFSDTKREVSFQGNAYFTIEGNKASPFYIDTERVEIEIVGTSFFVENEKDKPFQLSVQKGLVKVKNKRNKAFIYVRPGETVTYASNQLVLEKTKDGEMLEQYKKSIRFKDETLIHILHAINRENPDIELKTTVGLEQKKINIAFDNSSPESIVHLLCLALNARCIKENNTLLITEQ